MKGLRKFVIEWMKGLKTFVIECFWVFLFWLITAIISLFGIIQISPALLGIVFNESSTSYVVLIFPVILLFEALSKFKKRYLESKSVRVLDIKGFNLPIPEKTRGIIDFLSYTIVTGIQIIFIPSIMVYAFSGEGVWAFIGIVLAIGFGAFLKKIGNGEGIKSSFKTILSYVTISLLIGFVAVMLVEKLTFGIVAAIILLFPMLMAFYGQ